MGQNEDYEKVLRHAAEKILVVAVRYAVDTRRLVIEFDANRAPGPHDEHTLTISVRDSSVAVSTENIPHGWLSMGTGFADARLSRLAGSLLIELQHKAREAGVVL